MKEVVFLLEEESAKALIEGIFSSLLVINLPVRYIVFEGKQDLEKQMVRKIKNYNNSEAHFIILRDQDSGDCMVIKRNLQAKCAESGKNKTVVRIACREIESWYLADLNAVEKAFKLTGLSKMQEQKKYRDPDYLGSPSQELKKIVPEYQKVNGSRQIAKFLDINNTRSKSFYHFIKSIKNLMNI